ncbi:hypothetical protein [Shouchella patagoniensis]|uniref:hypothetical protein n=1 Tax=Shouchella patagoniensis TaxID=228576 RepID=UPI00099575C3|nr:hypothetical protein [Shouchella patagoniensis]
MLKKGLIAAFIVSLIAIFAYEPTVLAAAAESESHASDTDSLMRWTLNILSVATLAFLVFLSVTDRG